LELKISPAEYCQRLTNLQRSVAANGLELLVVTSFESIFYLTGAGFEPLERPFFLLVKPNGPPTLLVPKLDQEHMSKAVGIEPENICSYREYPAPQNCGWSSRLQEILPTHGQIGIEPTARREITDELRDYSMRTVSLVEQLRLVKSQAEIAMIQRAAKYADIGVERLIGSSYFGSSIAEGFAQTRSVSAKIIREVKDWDALTTKVLMATWGAPRSAMPHSVPMLQERLEVGPHVALVLTRVNGYSAESERTYFTSPPSSVAKTAFTAMMEARHRALAMIRPGVSCSELDSTVTAFLTDEGYAGEDMRLHRIGHGIGLGTHEGPWLAEGSFDRLDANMVISIEPGIYLKDIGGFRHSDTVLVTESGYEMLTHYPTELEKLVITNWKPIERCKGWLLRHSLQLSTRNRFSRTVSEHDLLPG
jgi:Xaa-Pro dipeptidase